MSPYCVFSFFCFLSPGFTHAQKLDVDEANVLLQTDQELMPQRRAEVGTMQQLLKIASSSDVSSSADADAGMIPRPNVGKGPDEVTFGMQVKNFYGVDLSDNDFTIDMVLTLKWMDKRNIHLIPKGAPNVTLSQAEAEQSCWMPQVSVTNMKIHKLDIISTGVTLLKSGEVIKVQRFIVIVLNNYQVREYPFDGQTLDVKIASTQYMSNALQLTPDQSPSWTGVSTSDFTGTYALKSWSMYQVEDNNGLLKKSRGVLSMVTQRKLTSYFSQHFVPCMYIVAMSCAVFYMPFIGMFIMPRLSISIVAYLNYVTLAGSSDSCLPTGHPNTWNEVLNQNVELALVITACFNIYTEILFHQAKVEDLAGKIVNECKFLMPLLFIVVVTIIMICGACHTEQEPVDVTVKVMMALIVILYVFLCERRKNEIQRKQREADEVLAANLAKQTAGGGSRTPSEAPSR